MELFLTSEDLAFQDHCLQYARSELAPLAERLGEINEVPEDLRVSLSRAGIFGPLFPEEYGGTGVSSTASHVPVTSLGPISLRRCGVW